MVTAMMGTILHKTTTGMADTDIYTSDDPTPGSFNSCFSGASLMAGPPRRWGADLYRKYV